LSCHLGNARPALLNWLYALRTGGTYILRLDDTDRERSTEAFARAIEEDLAEIKTLLLTPQGLREGFPIVPNQGNSNSTSPPSSAAKAKSKSKQ